MTDLKPCPFCGSDDLAVEIINSPNVKITNMRQVVCYSCDAGGPAFPEWMKPERPVACWNTRAPVEPDLDTPPEGK